MRYIILMISVILQAHALTLDDISGSYEFDGPATKIYIANYMKTIDVKSEEYKINKVTIESIDKENGKPLMQLTLSKDKYMIGIPSDQFSYNIKRVTEEKDRVDLVITSTSTTGGIEELPVIITKVDNGKIAIFYGSGTVKGYSVFKARSQ